VSPDLVPALIENNESRDQAPLMLLAYILAYIREDVEPDDKEVVC
jgi:hypothetical protein